MVVVLRSFQPRQTAARGTSKGHIMARTTVAQLEAQVNAQVSAINANMDKMSAQLLAIAEALAAGQVKANKADSKPKAPKAPKKSWLTDCPDYATAAQRVEYDKLAKRAKSQLDAMKAALGTESVSCFIPVPKDQNRMPHSIRWNATYSS